MKLPAASVTKRFQTSSVHSMQPQRIIAELSGEGSSDGTMVGLSESLAGGETKIGLRVVGCSDDDGESSCLRAVPRVVVDVVVDGARLLKCKFSSCVSC